MKRNVDVVLERHDPVPLLAQVALVIALVMSAVLMSEGLDPTRTPLVVFYSMATAGLVLVRWHLEDLWPVTTSAASGEAIVRKPITDEQRERFRETMDGWSIELGGRGQPSRLRELGFHLVWLAGIAWTTRASGGGVLHFIGRVLTLPGLAFFVAFFPMLLVLQFSPMAAGALLERIFAPNTGHTRLAIDTHRLHWADESWPLLDCQLRLGVHGNGRHADLMLRVGDGEWRTLATDDIAVVDVLRNRVEQLKFTLPMGRDEEVPDELKALREGRERE